MDQNLCGNWVGKMHFRLLSVYRKLFFPVKFDAYEINGYNLESFSTRGVKRGGTAIYCKSDIKFTAVKLNSKFEISAVQIIFDKKNLLVINNDTIQKDYDDLISQFNCDFIFCGDFNAHHKLLGNSQINTKGRELYNSIFMQ